MPFFEEDEIKMAFESEAVWFCVGSARIDTQALKKAALEYAKKKGWTPPPQEKVK